MLSGYDLDDDGKLSFQELTYVLDEFIGDLCFTCTCPTVHDKKVSPLAGAITALETLQNLPVAAITFSVFTAIGVFILYSLELRMCLDCWDLAAAAHHERAGGGRHRRRVHRLRDQRLRPLDRLCVLALPARGAAAR